MLNFRDLTADDIEIRVAQATSKGCSLLLYKDARCDMRILDETVGPENWQRKHYECKGNLFCSVGIKTDDGWIWKDDCGAESYTEKEKGEASDSFKRACVNWGIGRELYTAPFIFFPKELARIEQDEKGKYKVKSNFKVTEIVIEDKTIMSLKIAVDGKPGFEWIRGIIKAKPQKKADFKANKCVNCDNVIKGIRSNGNILSAAEVAKHTGGLCMTCYKQMEQENAG